MTEVNVAPGRRYHSREAILATLPTTSSTAMVSPIMAPILRSTAAVIPDDAAGMVTFLMSATGSPRAKDPL